MERTKFRKWSPDSECDITPDLEVCMKVVVICKVLFNCTVEIPS